MFVSFFLMIGIGTTLNWTMNELTTFLNWEQNRKKQLIYNLVCMSFLWSQLWLGWNISSNPFLFSNWPYLLFGYFFYETGYMIENRSCFSPHGYRVWIQHHFMSLILIGLLIVVYELNLLTIRQQDPQWLFYWHWTTVVYFAQLIYSIFYNRLDWHYWKIRVVTFWIQRVFRIVIIGQTIFCYWDHPTLIFIFVLPVGIGLELLDVYYDTDSISRLHVKLSQETK